MYKVQQSSKIFDHLMNGKIINKYKINNSAEFVENEMFLEIMNNLADYTNQWRMNGFDFVVEPSYLFIRERTSDRNDLKTDITMKVCVLLLLIGKYLTENNYKLSKITDTSGGLAIADIEAIMGMPDCLEILKKSKLNTDLHAAIKTALVDRNIMLEKPGSKSYLLSDSGKAFYEEVIANYQNVSEEYS